MQTQWDTPHDHDTTTYMQLSSWSRCTAASVVCWLCLQRVSDCFAAFHGGRVPVPIHPPTFYPDAPHARTCFGQCCTGSGIYVLQLRRHLWFASVHGMSSPSHHFSGNPMHRPQQLQVIIIHWTCRHVYGDPSPTWGDPRCVLHFMFNYAAAPGASSAFSYNYFWSLCCEIM